MQRDLSGEFRRQAELSIRGEKDEVELSFSSELPVKRRDWETGNEFMEILSHDPGDVDLSRLNNAHPVLLNHNADQQVGVVLKASIGSDKRGRAKVKFSNSTLAQEVLDDVRRGIRALCSVGYRKVKELGSELKDGIEHVRFAWQPYEISVVPVPADPSVGVGRNSNPPLNHRIFMNEQTNHRESEIRGIAKCLAGKIADVDLLAERAVLENTPLETFRQDMLARLPKTAPVSQLSPLRDVNVRDWSRYSITRAVRNYAEGRRLDGFEAEMNQELARANGKDAEGFYIPFEALASRSHIAGTGTLGGMLVSTPNLGAEFVELLRNRAEVINMGARILNLPNPVTIPRQSGSGATNWVGESVASTLTAMNFQQLTLTPYAISAYQQYSKNLMILNNPSIDLLIRDDIVKGIALAIDLAALHGTGSGQPTGIANTSGVGTVALAANGQALNNSTAYPALVSLETTISASNADVGSMGYLVRPAHRGALKTAQRFASTDSPVYETTQSGEGRINGYAARVTAQLANNLTHSTATTIASCIVMGNFSDLLVAQFGNGLDVISDPFSMAERAVVRICARQYVDIGVRHPASFAILGGILGG